MKIGPSEEPRTVQAPTRAPRASRGPAALLARIVALAVVAGLGCSGEGGPSPDSQGAATDASGRSSEPSPVHGVVPPTVPPIGADDSANASAEGFPLGAEAREGRSADGVYRVRWAPVGGAIPELEPFAIALEVRRTDGAALSPGAVVRVDAEMPHHGHGMNLVPEVRRAGTADGAARFVANGLLLHMSGRWVLAVDVEEDGMLERTQWHVDIE